MLLTSILLNLSLCLLVFNYQWKHQKAIVYSITCVILFNIRQIIILLLNSDSNSEILAALMFHLDPLTYLIGPFIFYYYRSLLEGKLVFDKTLLFLCLPSILLFINFIPYLQIPFQEKVDFASRLQHHVQTENLFFINTWLFPRNFLKAIIPGSIIFFISYSFWYVQRFNKAKLVKVKSLKIIQSTLIIILIAALPMLFFVLVNQFQTAGNTDFVFRAPNKKNSIFFYYYTLVVPLAYLCFPKLVYGLNPNASVLNHLNSLLKNRFEKSNEKEFSKAKNTSDLELIMDYLDRQKPYLKKDLSLHDISRELNIPHLRVSSCFNKQLNTSFPEFRNRLRIKHAISLFQSKAHFQMSIEGIAAQCGFKNKSSFYSAFKDEYGTTPIEWIKKEGLFI
jgi:AraC-like DNA-binding protein